MSGLVKGVVKAVKGIFRGVKKIFKKITSSTIGKVLLAAVAIYLGGAAFGMWESPFASINGAFVSEAATATVGASTGLEAGAVAGELGLGEAAATGASMGLSPTAAAAEMGLAEVAATGAPMGLPATTASSTMLPSALTTGGGGATGGNLLSRLGRGAGKLGKWAGKNPLPAAIGLSAIASGLSPDEEDIMELYEKQRQKRIQEAYAGVGNINLGVQPRDMGQMLDLTKNPISGGGSILQRIRANRKIQGGT